MARRPKPATTTTLPDPSRVASTPVSTAATTSAAAPTSSVHARIKQRAPHSRSSGRLAQQKEEAQNMDDVSSAERRPLAHGSSDDAESMSARAVGKRNQWIVFALASGACAAFNGVFAKLATGELTSSISKGVAQFLHLSAAEAVIEVVVRCAFFGLNLAFNGIMWTLFTQALARGNSTTQVSIMNTSSNFVLTAVLGFAVFSESLPPLWWLGAAMLVAGNVIIGQKDESSKTEESGSADVLYRDGDAADDSSLSEASAAEDGFGAYRDAAVVDRLLAAQLEKDAEDGDVLQLGDMGER